MNHTTQSAALFDRFPTYLWRWCVVGAVGAMLSPVFADDFWHAKLIQGLGGVVFGMVCAVIFTPLQNAINTPRKRWLSWVTVLGTWMSIKLVAAFAMS